MKKRFTAILLTVVLLLTYTVTGAAAEFCEILLPAEIHGVVGTEMNLFYDNIILCNNIAKYQIRVEAEKGEATETAWSYVPQAAESFPVKVQVLKNGNELVTEASTQIIVRDTAGSGAEKKVLCIGDSWTENVFYVSQLRDHFLGQKDGDTIKLLGTMTNWGTEEIRYEGRGGWSTETYCTQQTYGGKSNLFYNPDTQAFDFSYYLTQNGIETPDVVVLFLGINDVGHGVATAKTIQNMNEMIASIHAVKADIDIGVVLTPPPGASQDGFGKNNACGTTRFAQKTGAFRLAQAMVDAYDGGKMAHVAVIPVNSAVDCVDQYDYEEVKANAYSDVTIRRMTDNVHPVAGGYQQCADSIYGYIKSLF